MTTAKKLKFVFECDDCKKRTKSWPSMERHLNEHPNHAPEGYGAVNIYPLDEFSVFMS